MPDHLRRLTASAILGPASTHLAHAKYHDDTGSADDWYHPGAWPIPELAIVLVRGVAALVADLDSQWAERFTPSPATTLADLVAAVGVSFDDRPVSKNRDVARLTHPLRTYLADHPIHAD